MMQTETQTVNVHVDTTAQAEQPESALRAEFTVPRTLRKCMETESYRYALAHTLVTPATDGVFVTATDGRGAVVVRSDGYADAQHFAPHEVMRTRKASTTVQLNGIWKNSDGRTELNEQEPGRFPRIGDIIPDYDDCECLRVNLDAEILHNVTETLGTLPNGRGVILSIPYPKGSRYATGPVTVQGGRGIGAIMPLAIDQSEREQFSHTLREYREAERRYRNHPIGQPLD